ncbi:hypothetical protein HYS97_02990 [Candidatus Daviesbacteria bacterium]|nr:hypothetical protein [Candidatus Daviesbacteria bacterium]
MPPYSPPSRERSGNAYCAKFIQVDGRLFQTGPALELNDLMRHEDFAKLEKVWYRIIQLRRSGLFNEYDGGFFYVNPKARTLSVGGDASTIGVNYVNKEARQRSLEMFAEQTPEYKIRDDTDY